MKKDNKVVYRSLSYQIIADMSREEGAQEVLSQAIIDLVHSRFPELESLATQQIQEQ